MTDAALARAIALDRSGRTAQAFAAIETALSAGPTSAAALSVKAGLLMKHRRHDAAEAALETLLRHHPNDGRGWLNYGHLLKSAGRIDVAVAAYRRAIAGPSRPGVAWWSLANLKSVRLDRTDIAAMQALLGKAETDDAIHLHFALGRALGDHGDHAAAFAHLQSGNALRLSIAPHDADATSAMVRGTEHLFTRAFLDARAGAGAQAADPIFIIGLPRSGSTLVEQILASHPLIDGRGELHDLHGVAQAIPAGDPTSGHLAGLADLPPPRLRDLGERYLQAAQHHRTTERPFFTDKMPSNWIYTGLIRLILPNARIIDVRRGPMACGFANYAQHYHRGNNFAYDLAGIGRFYADYAQHMAHFDRIAPGHVHRIMLEDLIDDPDHEVRRLLDHLGLPFDPACLRFHEASRPVHTPSADQVRRPINRDGQERWRPYARWLGPLEEALRPA